MGTLQLRADVYQQLLEKACQQRCSTDELLQRWLHPSPPPLTQQPAQEEQTALKALIENVPGSAWSIDTSYCLQAANTRFLRSYEEAFGHRLAVGECILLPTLAPPLREEWQGYFDRVLAGETFTVERVSHFTARVHDVEFRFTPICTAQGQVSGATIHAQNITERRQAALQLQRTEAHLRAMLNSTWQSFTLIDQDYHIIDAAETSKKTAEAIFGRRMQTGDSIFDFVLQRDHEAFQQNYLKALAGERVVIEKVFPTLQGETLYFEVSYYPVTDCANTIIGVCMTFQDVTERTVAQRALRQSEARLRTLLDTQSAYVVRSDMEGHYAYTNQAFAARYAWLAEDLVGRSLMETVVPEDHPKVRSTVSTCIAQPGKPVQVVLQKLAPPHEAFWTLWEFTALQDQSGTVIEIQCIGFDITAQIQAEQIRLEQERLKASLRKEHEFNALVQRAVAALSHDIRTPLSVIESARYVLDRYFDRIDEEMRREKLETISHQLHYVLLLLNDLSLTVKGKLDDHRFQPTDLNLEALCQVIVDELRHSIGSNHELYFTSDQQIQIAQVDETLVSRILLNLLSNAIKFSPEQQPIELHLSRRDGWIVLSVVDHGMGISDEDLQHIFEPFYRSEAVESIHGTGLGLSIVQDCVQRHQGTISVRSHLGEGTAFIVELPLQKSRVSVQEPPLA